MTSFVERKCRLACLRNEAEAVRSSSFSARAVAARSASESPGFIARSIAIYTPHGAPAHRVRESPALGTARAAPPPRPRAAARRAVRDAVSRQVLDLPRADARLRARGPAR